MPLETFLEWFEFEYENSNGIYKLIDMQGANLGGIEQEEFNSIAEIVDRLDIYYTDYIYEILCDDFGECGLDYDGVEDYPTILKWLEENNHTDIFFYDYINCIVNPDLIYEN